MDFQKNASSVKNNRLSAATLDFIIFVFITSTVSIFLIVFIRLDAFLDAPIHIFQQNPKLFAIITTLTSLAVGIWYYGVTPTRNKGQTRAKKYYHVKAVDAHGQNPSLAVHLKRAIMLYSHYIGTPLLLLILTGFNLYDTLDFLLDLISWGIVLVSLVLVFNRSDARGLHDMIAKTYVVDEHFSKEGQVESPTKKNDSTAIGYDAFEDKDPGSQNHP
ncbi:MAG: RDD family protein [Bacillota bacterium]